jgi:hypothetical protein
MEFARLRSYIGFLPVRRTIPNPTHHALAALQHAGVVGPLITQNVDGLHHAALRRILSEPEVDQRILELHGSIFVSPISVCFPWHTLPFFSFLLFRREVLSDRDETESELSTWTRLSPNGISSVAWRGEPALAHVPCRARAHRRATQNKSRRRCCVDPLTAHTPADQILPLSRSCSTRAFRTTTLSFRTAPVAKGRAEGIALCVSFITTSLSRKKKNTNGHVAISMTKIAWNLDKARLCLFRRNHPPRCEGSQVRRQEVFFHIKKKSSQFNHCVVVIVSSKAPTVFSLLAPRLQLIPRSGAFPCFSLQAPFCFIFPMRVIVF